MSTTSQLTDSPVRCFETEVVRVQRLSSSFTRITLGGDCLSRFDACGPLGPRDLRIKVIVPVGPVPPEPIDVQDEGWYQRWLQEEPRRRGEMRTYTVRAARVDGPHPEVDIDFVLHGHDGSSGPAAAWAASASVGDRLLLLGPNAACDGRYGGIEWRPPVGGRVLLVGDETAVPAVASILATLPAGYAGNVLLEVPAADDFQALHSDAALEVTWLARSDRPRGELLVRAVRDLVRPAAAAAAEPLPDVSLDLLWETPEDDAPEDDTRTPYVWIAGEAAMVKELRRHLVGTVGMPRDRVAFMGYWREGGRG
jgi:NADPH-dependent ferric siderophore reductase